MSDDDWKLKYDGAVAALVSENERLGTLFLEIQSWKFLIGSRFHRRARGESKLAWRVVLPAMNALPDEGFYDSRDEAMELDDGLFLYKGKPYSIVWLDASEAELERRKYEGFDSR